MAIRTYFIFLNFVDISPIQQRQFLGHGLQETAIAQQYRPIEGGGHLVRKYHPDQFAPDYSGIIQFEGRKIRVRTWMEAKDRLMIKLEPLGVAATPIDD